MIMKKMWILSPENSIIIEKLKDSSKTKIAIIISLFVIMYY